MTARSETNTRLSMVYDLRGSCSQPPHEGVNPIVSFCLQNIEHPSSATFGFHS